MDSQAELFPFASPETLLAHCRRLEALILKVGPELNGQQCLRLLGELALTTTVAETISRSIERSSKWKLRETLPAIAPAVERSATPHPLPPSFWAQRARYRRRVAARNWS